MYYKRVHYIPYLCSINKIISREKFRNFKVWIFSSNPNKTKPKPMVTSDCEAKVFHTIIIRRPSFLKYMTSHLTSSVWRIINVFSRPHFRCHRHTYRHTYEGFHPGLRRENLWDLAGFCYTDVRLAFRSLRLRHPRIRCDEFWCLTLRCRDFRCYAFRCNVVVRHVVLQMQLFSVHSGKFSLGKWFNMARNRSFRIFSMYIYRPSY